MEHYPLSVTPGSSGDAPFVAPERRTEERLTTLLRIAKLITTRDQRLCMVRNISSAGAMLRLYQPITLGEPVQVEITPECPVAATVIWTMDDHAGVAFVEPIDVIAALRGCAGKSNPYRRATRLPRLRVEREARLCTDDIECDVVLCDVSLNGAKIVTDAELAEDVEVAIFVGGLHPLSGRIRWCHDRHAGVQFDVPIPMDTLADWAGANDEGDENDAA